MKKIKKLAKKYRVKISKQGLEDVHALYESNWIDSDKGFRSMEKEKELNDLATLLQRELGVYVPTPCPILSSRGCAECTGYYKRVVEGTHVKSEMSSEGHKCVLYEYSENGGKIGLL